MQYIIFLNNAEVFCESLTAAKKLANTAKHKDLLLIHQFNTEEDMLTGQCWCFYQGK